MYIISADPYILIEFVFYAALEELKDVEMENFFSDDEEFMGNNGSGGVAEEVESTPVAQALVNPEAFDMENPVFLYRMFYSSLFPWKAYFHWLNYDSSKVLNYLTNMVPPPYLIIYYN